MNEPVAWMSSVGGEFVYVGYEPGEGYLAIPLYTHHYERPHNTVLVPCDKLAEMQAEIEALKEVNAQQVNYISEQKLAYEKLWKEHMELFWKHEQDKDETNEQ